MQTAGGSYSSIGFVCGASVSSPGIPAGSPRWRGAKVLNVEKVKKCKLMPVSALVRNVVRVMVASVQPCGCTLVFKSQRVGSVQCVHYHCVLNGKRAEIIVDLLYHR